MTTSSGTIYLVGAGLGSPEYLTLQAYGLLIRAEVLIYDALVDDSILKLTPENCLRINVGKRGGQPSASQAEINQLLVQSCQQGHQVVRLKGGDPFIFGRTTSEIQALVAAKCPFQVIPGLSSALAAPLLARIPLTDPVMSRGFAVITAHEPEALDWENLTPLDTLVILMGARNLPEILHQLQRHGRSPQTPMAVIQHAGRSQQQVWVSTLQDIMGEIPAHSLSPCVMVVGEVVGLREFLASPESRSFQSEISFPVQMPQVPGMNSPLPLTRKTILVTRAEGQSSQFRDLLVAQGAAVLELPALVIGPPSSWAELDQAIAQLSSSSQNSGQNFDWLILTSANGVDAFFQRLQIQGKDSRVLAKTKIAVVGKKPQRCCVSMPCDLTLFRQNLLLMPW